MIDEPSDSGQKLVDLTSYNCKMSLVMSIESFRATNRRSFGELPWQFQV